ncbi:InlB B-repeat-containing protein [uncultured Treponema sp.]|uniref:InlB B-repeat-containing protein n=1 Tax=uncultured Treponema sp. TaxID=162155 RepID=UPI002594B543|nr:InlB B-repeat-containing protein [uncultured Treponema sp.]
MRKIINRKIKFFAVASIFMLSIFGCKNSFEVEEEQSQNVTGKTGITLAGISFNEKESNARTAFPKYDKTAFTDIELKGKKSAMSGEMTSYKTYATYADIMRDSGVIELDATAYDFTLTAKCYGAAFSSTLSNISIQDGITTKLNFTMAVTDETATGLLYLYYPSAEQDTTLKFTVSVGTSDAVEVTYDTDLKRYVYSKLLAPQNSQITAIMENTATGKILTVPVYAIVKSGAKTTINFEEVFSGLYELYSYSVTYNANGSASADTVQKFNPNSSIEDCTFEAPEGKKFCGWNTSSDGSGTRYSAGDTPVLDCDITLYAQWVTYDTATSTYTISSADELRAFFSYATDEISYKDAKLLEDVTVSDWCVPGTFRGTFDGNGKTLTITSVKEFYSEKDTSTGETKTYSGFLSILRGTVKSLIIKNSGFGSTKCDYTGAVAGKIDLGTIDSVNVERTTVTAKNCAGLIAGYNNYGFIKNCYAGGNATLTTVTSSLSAGGITGQNNGYITGCTVDAITISAGRSGYAGGITGINSKSISSSKLHTPNASVSAKYAAGIAGKNEETASITDCEVKQDASSSTSTTITGVSHAGGIAALNAGKIDNPAVSSIKVTTTGTAPYTGGIAGYNDTTGTIVTGGTVDINYDSALDGNYGYVIGYNANTTASAVTTDIVCSNSKAISDNESYSVATKSTKYLTLTLKKTTKITLSVTDNSGGGAIYAYLSSEKSTSTSLIAQTGKVDGTTKTVCAGYLPKGTYYIGLYNDNIWSSSTGTYTITAD